MAAATAVESTTAAMETAATTVEASTGTVETASTVIAAANLTVSYVPAAAVVAMTAVITVAAVSAPTRASPVSGATPIAAAIPRAGANEEAAGEPARAVVAVGCASVRVVSIVSVSADGSWAHVPRSDSNADDNALRMRVRRDRQAKSE